MKNRILLPLICMAISIFAASCSSEAVDYPEAKEQMVTLVCIGWYRRRCYYIESRIRRERRQSKPMEVGKWRPIDARYNQCRAEKLFINSN